MNIVFGQVVGDLSASEMGVNAAGEVTLIRWGAGKKVDRCYESEYVVFHLPLSPSCP